MVTKDTQRQKFPRLVDMLNKSPEMWTGREKSKHEFVREK